jgi:hypothetical protein
MHFFKIPCEIPCCREFVWTLKHSGKCLDCPAGTLSARAAGRSRLGAGDSVTSEPTVSIPRRLLFRCGSYVNRIGMCLFRGRVGEDLPPFAAAKMMLAGLEES